MSNYGSPRKNSWFANARIGMESALAVIRKPGDKLRWKALRDNILNSSGRTSAFIAGASAALVMGSFIAASIASHGAVPAACAAIWGTSAALWALNAYLSNKTRKERYNRNISDDMEQLLPEDEKVQQHEQGRPYNYNEQVNQNTGRSSRTATATSLQCGTDGKMHVAFDTYNGTIPLENLVVHQREDGVWRKLTTREAENFLQHAIASKTPFCLNIYPQKKATAHELAREHYRPRTQRQTSSNGVAR